MNLTLPNLISLARMGLIPLFVIAVLEGEPLNGLVIFAIAGISDGVDGFIARYFNQRSPLGAVLDPIADKLLLTTAYVMLAIPNTHPGLQIPLWITVLVLARDISILLISVTLYLVHKIESFPPTVLSKVNTALQITAIVLVLVSGLRQDFERLALVTLYAVATLTILSGLMYVPIINRLVGGSGSSAPPDAQA